MVTVNLNLKAGYTCIIDPEWFLYEHSIRKHTMEFLEFLEHWVYLKTLEKALKNLEKCIAAKFRIL